MFGSGEISTLVQCEMNQRIFLVRSIAIAKQLNALYLNATMQCMCHRPDTSIYRTLLSLLNKLCCNADFYGTENTLFSVPNQNSGDREFPSRSQHSSRPHMPWQKISSLQTQVCLVNQVYMTPCACGQMGLLLWHASFRL